jgi:alkaline phosphatase D
VYCRQFEGSVVFADKLFDQSVIRSFSDDFGFDCDDALGGRTGDSCYDPDDGFDGEDFTGQFNLSHGWMLGAIEATTARVWVKTDATRRIGLRLATNIGDLRRAPVSGWVYPTAATEFSGVLEVDRLEPDTRYMYNIEVDGLTDGTLNDGFFDTPPAPGTPHHMRFVMGSCAKYGQDHSLFGTISALQPSLALMVGDNHYSDSADLAVQRWAYRWMHGERAERSTTCGTPTVGARWCDEPVSAAFQETRERVKMFQRVPTLAVWDDHDFIGNDSHGGVLSNPFLGADAQVLKDRALRAFKESWANPSYGEPDVPGIYFKHSHGDVDFFMLDDRFYRAPNDWTTSEIVRTFENGRDLLDSVIQVTPGQAILGNPSIIGRRQTAWLRRELLASTARIKFVVTGSAWSDIVGGGESWSHYAPARDAIFDFVQENGIRGVVFVGGDVHKSQFGFMRSPEGAEVMDGLFPELVSSPLAQTGNSSCDSDGRPPQQLACFSILAPLTENPFEPERGINYVMEVSVNTDVEPATMRVRVLGSENGVSRGVFADWSVVNTVDESGAEVWRTTELDVHPEGSQ